MLLEPNHPFSADRLIEDVWDGKRIALHTLESHLDRVRKVVGVHHLPHGSGGFYRIVVGDDDLDSIRFERLLDSGRQELSRSAAKDLLQEALGCWRGHTLLEDMPDAMWAAPQRQHFEERRARALESWFDARLQLGEHDDVIPIAQQAVEDHPYRERLWAKLILALYRANRQQEAIETFERLRRKLLEDVGVDPGPELQELQRDILNQDPSLLPPVTANAASRRNHLPAPLNDFVGRNDDVARLTKHLEESRLVTLVGPGGAGKTRLALQVALGLAGDMSGGAWFAELDSVADPALAIQVVADTLGFHPRSEKITIEGLSDYIGDQELLLVVDNCEHVIAEAAFLIEGLLRGAGRTKVLATSRETLGVYGEVVCPVEPMAVPGAQGLESDDETWACDSVRLFVQRAEAVDPSVDLGRDASAIGDIVTRLEGLPLAIELAAARVDTLRPVDILDRLEHRFELLKGGPRHAPSRQQSLEGAIDWSYRLLSPAEGTLFRRSSIFLGTFSLEGLQSVAWETSLERPAEVEQVVRQLVSKSLMICLKSPDMEPRYRLLDSIREFAETRLGDAPGDEATRTREAHAEFYVGLASRARTGLCGPDQRRWLSTVSQEMPDVRVALEFLADSPGRLEEAYDVFGSLSRYWFLRAQPAEALSLAESLLDREASASPGRAAALLAGVWASVYQRPRLARRWGDEALALAERLGDRRLAGEAAAMLAATSFFAGTPDVEVGGKAIEYARDLDDPVLLGLAGMGLGLARFTEDHAMARDAFEGALRATEVSDDRLVRYVCLTDLGELSRSEGSLSDAEALYSGALEIREELAYEDSLTSATFGLLLLDRGRVAEARPFLLEAFYWGRGHSLQQAIAPLYGLATYAVKQERYETAARLYGFADSRTEGTGLVFPDLKDARCKNVSLMSEGLGAAYDELYQTGGSLGWSDLIAEVEALP
jgi:predicted ATPase/DNA-binding SARP family transcriptional activator